MHSRLLRSISWLFVTGVVIFILGRLIIPEYKKADQRLHAFIEKSKKLKGFARVEEKAKILSLNVALPDSFEYLLRVSAQETPVDADRLKEYLHYYQQVVKYIPFYADGFALLGFCYYHAGELDKAIVAYEQARNLSPYFFWNSYNLGLLYIKKGRLSDGINALRWVTALKWSDVPKVLLTSKLYTQMGLNLLDLDKVATANLREAQKSSCLLLIMAYEKLYRFKEVINVAYYAIDNKIADPDIFFFYAGVACYKMQQYKEAIAFFQKSIASNPRLTSAYHYLGLTLESLGSRDQAQKLLSQASILEKSGQGTKLPLLDGFQPRIF